jgi:hypothetical protein
VHHRRRRYDDAPPEGVRVSDELSGRPGELESFRYLKATFDWHGFRTDLIQHEAYVSLLSRRRLFG